jgi:hypothetical protein
MKAQAQQEPRRLVLLVPLAVALTALALSLPAEAQRERRAGASQWHGDASRSHWSGHGRHAWHGGYRGHAPHWSLSIGGLWYPYPYAYPAPVYPYPAPVYPYSVPWVPVPPVSAVAAEPPAQYWYFCEASRTYYPYVTTCPGGWKPVPATPTDVSPVPQQ